MRSFEFRTKVLAEDSLLRQRLTKRLDRGGDPVKTGDDLRERRKSRPEILAFHRTEMQQVLEPCDGRRESPIIRFRALAGLLEEKRRANREAVAEFTQGQAHLFEELFSGVARPNEGSTQ